jgi:hypothetical protein
MSLRDASQFLEELGVQRSHVAIHDWVHKAELQPLSTVTADQIAVNEKMIRLHGQGPGCTARSIHTPTKRCTPEVREVVCLERAIAEQDATDDFALMIGQRPMVAGLASRPVLGQ